MGVRDYDPSLGEFTTPDTVFLESIEKMAGQVVSANLFSYAANDPINFVDPFGTDEMPMQIFLSNPGMQVGPFADLQYVLALEAQLAPTTHDDDPQPKPKRAARPMPTATPHYKPKSPGLNPPKSEHWPQIQPIREATISYEGDAPWMIVAKSQIGIYQWIGPEKDNDKVMKYWEAVYFKEFPRAHDDTAWCSAFASWVMETAGVQGARSASPLTWKNWGRQLDRPAVGAVAVMEWPGGGKHVGFVAGIDARTGNIILLGGNQYHAGVNYNASSKPIVGYYFPEDYIVPESAYDLPVLTISEGGHKVTPAKQKKSSK
jgi:uncharacterized protein (TIGR02594 family)